MKYTSGFLTILIFTTVVSADNASVLNNVKSIVKNVQNLANMHLDGILTPAQNLVSDTTNRTNAINSVARENINQLLTGLVNAMRNRPETVQFCNPISPSSIESLRSVFRKNIDACMNDLRTAVATYRDTVIGAISEMKATFANLTAIYANCPLDFEGTISCAAQKANQVQNLTTQSMQTAHLAHDILMQKTPGNLTQIQTCVNESVDEARILVNKVIESMYQCPSP